MGDGSRSVLPVANKLAYFCEPVPRESAALHDMWISIPGNQHALSAPHQHIPKPLRPDGILQRLPTCSLADKIAEQGIPGHDNAIGASLRVRDFINVFTKPTKLVLRGAEGATRT